MARKTVKKAQKEKKPFKDVYAEYRKTLKNLIFLDRDSITRLVETLDKIIPDKVLDKNPDLARDLAHVRASVNGQNDLKRNFLKLYKSDKTAKDK